jgi:2'-5' RNA ligase
MAKTLACLLLPPGPTADIVALQREFTDYRPLLPPHLTLLPPVHEGTQADLLAQRMGRITAGSPALALTVGPPATFLPDEPVVYFAISGAGLPWLHAWHRELAGDEPGARPFVPHVTLVYRLPHELLLRYLEAARDATWEVTIEAVHLVSYTDQPEACEWHVGARIPLSG